MDDVVILLLIPAVLIGLNHLARNPRAQGRAWRVSGMLMRFGVVAAAVGFVVVAVFGLTTNWGGHLEDVDGYVARFVALVAVCALISYATGVLALLISLLTRAWLRFDAYLHKVGPANFAKGAADVGWTVGKSGLKLYGMAVVALVAMHFVGLRNLLFLRGLSGVMGGGPLFGDPQGPQREDDARRADAPPAS